MTQTFTPPRKPGSVNWKAEDNAVICSFGDGYTQRYTWSLAPLRRSLSLSWQGLTARQAEQLSAFFSDLRGRSFTYDLGDGHGPRRLYHKSHSAGWQGGAVTFTAELEEARK